MILLLSVSSISADDFSYAGGGIGLSHLSLVLDNGTRQSIASLTMSARARYGNRLYYHGRMSAGLPLRFAINGEVVPLETENSRSVSFDTLHGVGVATDPNNGTRWFAAIGAQANLTLVVPEDSAFGPPPVTAFGPGIDGGVEFSPGPNIRLLIEGGAGFGFMIVEMAADHFDPSSVSFAVPKHLSASIMFRI